MAMTRVGALSCGTAGAPLLVWAVLTTTTFTLVAGGDELANRGWSGVGGGGGGGYQFPYPHPGGGGGGLAWPGGGGAKPLVPSLTVCSRAHLHTRHTHPGHPVHSLPECSLVVHQTLGDGGGGGGDDPINCTAVLPGVTEGCCHALSSNARWGLMDSARHIIKRAVNPRFWSLKASFDVASTI